MSLGVVSVMVNWEEASGHNPHFYCLLTGFPATLPALSRIALGHESLTSPGRWRKNDFTDGLQLFCWRMVKLLETYGNDRLRIQCGGRLGLGRLPSCFLSSSTLGDTSSASLISINIYTEQRSLHPSSIAHQVNTPLNNEHVTHWLKPCDNQHLWHSTPVPLNHSNPIPSFLIFSRLDGDKTFNLGKPNICMYIIWDFIRN